MLSLAEPFSYDDPPTSYLSSTPGSAIVKCLVWYRLASDTRKGYAVAINSYVSFCTMHNGKPWPSQMIMLEEWAATRIFGSTLPKQGQIKPDTVLSYLSTIKSYHIKSRLSLGGFDNPRMILIIKSGRRLFPSKKQNRLPFTKEILEKIKEEELLSITDLNVDTAFRVAWAGFMRMGELTYTATEAKKATFAETGLTRSDISFAEGDQYAILRLKQSKTDTEYTGVQIILAATGEPTCPVAILRRLFIQDLRPPNAPLFTLQSSAFSHQAVVNILKQRIAAVGLPEANYSGHSVRKRAAQHAADYGILDETIQRLGRWTSNAFKLYFTTTLETLFNFNLRFQKGRPLAALQAKMQGPTVTAMRGLKP